MSEEEGTPKTAKTEPKKRAKKQPPPPQSGPVYVITDLEEWERLLRDVPLKSGEIRFYRGKAFGVAFT